MVHCVSMCIFHPLGCTHQFLSHLQASESERFLPSEALSTIKPRSKVPLYFISLVFLTVTDVHDYPGIRNLTKKFIAEIYLQIGYQNMKFLNSAN